MYVGTQIRPRDDSDYRVWAQLGGAACLRRPARQPAPLEPRRSEPASRACRVVRPLARHGAIADGVTADRGAGEPAHPAGEGPRAAARDRQHLRTDRTARRRRHSGCEIQPDDHRHSAHRARDGARRLTQCRVSLEPRRPDRAADDRRQRVGGRVLGADRPFPRRRRPGRDRRQGASRLPPARSLHAARLSRRDERDWGR